MKRAKSGSENAVVPAIRAVVIGSVCGAVLGAVLLCLCAFAFVSAKLFSQGIIFPIVLIISAISSFLAGFISARMLRKRGLLFGAITGLVLFLMFLLAGVITFHEILGAAAGTRLLIMVLAGATGGFLAMGKKTKIK